MTFFNERLLPIVEEILKNWEKKEILTADIIKRHTGNYVNDNCSANVSINASYGRFLKKNAEVLKIKQMDSDVTVVDDCGNKTTCSRWAIL